MHIDWTKESRAELEAWAESHPDQPIVMLNLLRFNEQAHEGYGCDGMTGEEAYREYGTRLMSMDPAFEGTPIWLGLGQLGVIAPDDEHWDQIILVYYATASAFLAGTSRDEYLEAAPFRTAALADSRLVLSLELLRAPQNAGSEVREGPRG